MSNEITEQGIREWCVESRGPLAYQEMREDPTTDWTRTRFKHLLSLLDEARGELERWPDEVSALLGHDEQRNGEDVLECARRLREERDEEREARMNTVREYRKMESRVAALEGALREAEKCVQRHHDDAQRAMDRGFSDGARTCLAKRDGADEVAFIFRTALSAPSEPAPLAQGGERD